MLELARAANKLGDGLTSELIELRAENARLSAQLNRLESELAKLQTEARAKRKPGNKLNVADVPSLRVTQ